MRNKRILRASLESRIEEIAADLPPVEVVEPAASVEVVEVAEDTVPAGDIKLVTDVIEAQSETTDAVTAIDKLALAATQLETVRGNIEATIPNGGLTPTEAGAYSVATDAITAELGVQNTIPSMECFGGSMSRLQATQESLKSVADVVKRIGARGWEVLLQLIERIAKLASRVVARLTGLETRIAKAMVNIKSLPSGRFDIEVDSKVAVLIGGEGLEPKEVQDNLSAINKLVGSVTALRFGGLSSDIKTNTIDPIAPEVKFAPPFSIEETMPATADQMVEYEVRIVWDEPDTETTKVDVTGTLLERALEIASGAISSTNLKRYTALESTLSDMLKRVITDEKNQMANNLRHMLQQYLMLTSSGISLYNDIVTAVVELAEESNRQIKKQLPAKA